ncbi:MAG: hypothetical protein AB8G86_07115 [Saprospiraceae bacterium]
MESIITSKKYQSLSKGLGTAGVILGIMTLLFSFIPILGILAMLLGFITLIIIGVGLIVSVKHQHSKSRLITALVLAGLGTVISLMQFSALA